MKKFFTISAAVVMASSAISTAQTLSTVFEGRSNAAPNFVMDAIKNGNLPMREMAPVQLNKKASEMTLIDRADVSSIASKKPSAVAAGENPFYVATEGTYYMSTVLGPGRFAIYYNPYLISQAYNATFKPIVGNVWNSTAPSATDLSEYVNADGNLCLSEYGKGGWYGPAISNGGAARYYAGAYNPDKKDDYAILYCATETSPIPFGIYNMSENSGYTGFSDTYAYGSVALALDEKGENIIYSDVTMIDYGKPKGGSLLIDHIEFVGVSKTNQPLKDGATLDVQLETYDEEGNVKEVHKGIITADDIAPIQGTLYYVSASFFKDEDGFQAAYTPVINDEFCLFISGFANPNVDLGIEMIYDEGESNTTGAELGYKHDSWVLLDIQDGKGPLFRTLGPIDACVNLCGYYIGLCEYGTGSKVINGTVGLEGGDVKTVLPWNDGKILDAYLVESTFTVDDMSIYEAPDWVKITVDTTKFSENGYTFFIVEAEALTDGSAGRQGDVVIGMSEVDASMTLHIIQGTDEYINGTGIDNVKVSGAVYNAVVAGDDIVVSCPADVKTVNLYNAAGALVSTAAVENGKAVIKNAPAGLNLVNFNGKQSVKVVK